MGTANGERMLEGVPGRSHHPGGPCQHGIWALTLNRQAVILGRSYHPGEPCLHGFWALTLYRQAVILGRSYHPGGPCLHGFWALTLNRHAVMGTASWGVMQVNPRDSEHARGKGIPKDSGGCASVSRPQLVLPSWVALPSGIWALMHNRFAVNYHDPR